MLADGVTAGVSRIAATTESRAIAKALAWVLTQRWATYRKTHPVLVAKVAHVEDEV